MIDVLFFFYFFFQAEDGIRDWSVTGVQTCALPISTRERTCRARRRRRGRNGSTEGSGGSSPGSGPAPGATPPWWRSRRPRSRSEERRVGKECRARWAPDDGKETQKEAGEGGEYREM